MRLVATAIALSFVAIAHATPAYATELPAPLAQLSRDARQLAARLPAPSAVEIVDLSTGYHTGVNAGNSMPAASTIKIPVMVEVFAQLQSGRFDLNERVVLRSSDKDYGSGDLCDAPAGTSYSIPQLLDKMIDVSDNTATNMLIRLVGRSRINGSMRDLGLERTLLAGDIRTGGWSIRQNLRTSAADLVHLLSLMAHRELIDEWSSNEMIAVLEQDQINTLLPQPLPPNVPIAHKTGSFFDTLNDAGIVYADNAPYAIAVMTTALPSQGLGRLFIHSISKMAYAREMSFAQWRQAHGIESAPLSPGDGSSDLRYWSTGLGAGGSGSGG